MLHFCTTTTIQIHPSIHEGSFFHHQIGTLFPISVCAPTVVGIDLVETPYTTASFLSKQKLF